ncbi:ATP-binding cassette domain-containing protein [Lactobacillus sp. DCY120]|uniref:ATP-binding cassette domain-containing protein n=1 Tax=Bombilactobacillus apium TaxID=2675299 RepID=A0A850R1Y4_9LACO|nr:ATP-binding cassette domain-containing protein [Bombilactobacillus apium]NVY97139.1 ATP-binding cassette domain-containing protein [Bombilactobacillus apium]
MFKIPNLTLVQREPILQAASYTFQEGQIYLLQAENGSGKTTFLRSLVNLVPKKSRIISFGQVPCSQVKAKVFYFESSDWFNPNLSGKDYLQFIQQQWWSPIPLDPETQRRQMQDYYKLPIKKYSLGMKQKLLIDLYRVSGAQYLLMDEINNGSDQASREILYQQLIDLAQEGKLIIIASHYQDEIKIIVSQALSLKRLQLQED